MDRRGNIKLCDFGISGQLVDSIAKTRDAGCRPYMAVSRPTHGPLERSQGCARQLTFDLWRVLSCVCCSLSG